MAAHANGPHWHSEHLSESHGKGTRRPNLKIHISLFGWLHHFLSLNRKKLRAPWRNFSAVQRPRSRNQSNQMSVFPAESTFSGPCREP